VAVIVDQHVALPVGELSASYTVAGVLLHAGTAHHGHYRALIRENDGNWYLYDDSAVRCVGSDFAEVFSKCDVAHEVTMVRYSLA
jgi:ubiquitin C-terminal hydrolase